MNNILIGAAALAVVALIEGLYYALAFLSERQQEDLQRRLQPVTGADGARPSLLRVGRLSSNRVVEGLLEGVPFMERLATLLEQAQVGGTVATQLVFSLVFALVGAAAGLMLGGPTMGALLFVAGAAVPIVRLFFARARRSRLISEQLPAALDMMVRSLRAGHSLTSAFKLVATEMPAPINVEFARAYEEQNLGVSFERAVVQMTNRVPANRDLKIFAVSVIVQKETGGNLIELLDKLSDTIRGRYQFYGKLAALTAEGRLSGMVLAGLPVVTALVLMVLNLKYISALTNTSIGLGISLYAVTTWCVGLLWLRQMAKVEL